LQTACETRSSTISACQKKSKDKKKFGSVKQKAYLWIMKNEINSIYTVTELATGIQYEHTMIGDGQKAISNLRKKYPRFTKFVLEGFEINGKFIPLNLNRRY
jgi:hypothetical protein